MREGLFKFKVGDVVHFKTGYKAGEEPYENGINVISSITTSTVHQLENKCYVSVNSLTLIENITDLERELI